MLKYFDFFENFLFSTESGEEMHYNGVHTIYTALWLIFNQI